MVGTTDGVARKCFLKTAESYPVKNPADISTGGSLGLSICRTPQHPYPWVSSVTKGGAAEEAGLAPGDYLLHINNTPLLGLSVYSVATVAREADGVIEVTYWRPEGEDASLTSMLCIQRLVPKMDEILTAITCPICFEVPGIAIQCTNGHLLCLACRRRSFKCPICRTPLRTPSGIPLGGRNLFAEQLRSALLGSATSHEAKTKPKPTTETKDEPPSQQKQKKSVIQQFTSHLFHRSIDLKGLQRQIGAKTYNKRMSDV